MRTLTMGDDMISSKLRFIVLVMTVLVGSTALAEIDWAGVSGLSDTDKADIAELAQNSGLYNASSASEMTRLPTGDRYIVIRSVVSVNGLRRKWREFYACSEKEGSCPRGNRESVGEWSIAGEVNTQERWRFSDADWFVDVELGSGISYAEAESIVLAVHRNTLVSTPDSGDFRQRFDASRISSIQTVDPIAREFQVVIDEGGHGYVLQVRLRETEVQMYELITVTA